MMTGKRKFFVSCVMALIWLSVIAILLYAPAFLKRFGTSRSINLLVPPTMVEASNVALFEKSTGTKVYITYYESSHELVRKMEMTRGKEYDLIIAPDSSIPEFIAEGMLQKIEKKRLNFYGALLPQLLGHYFDPTNDYTIPYYLGVYGLGIDMRYFGAIKPTASWRLLFEPHGFCVTMTDDPRKAMMLAGYYLFGSINNLNNDAALRDITQLLIKQKKWVELYTDIRGEDLLASQTCPVALTISSDVWRMQREYTSIDFLVPQEGTFIVIDSFVIPKASTKQHVVYELLNFLYSPEMLKRHALKFGFCPPRSDVILADAGFICPRDLVSIKTNFFKQVVPAQSINDSWITVMAQ